MIIYQPAEKPAPCKHPGIPDSDTVPRGTRWYCDYCHKTYSTQMGDYGNSWDRWPMNADRWFLLLAPLIILTPIILALIFVGGGS